MEQKSLFQMNASPGELRFSLRTDIKVQAGSEEGVSIERSPITLSLFSGAGGLDIGFHKAGFRIVACVEIESHFCETLRLNSGKYSDRHCQIINKDIRELDSAEIDVPQIDFIIGGPPCQSFSAIGRRAGGVDGVRDARGSLFEHYCRLVRSFQPQGFLFENVRGILGANRGKDWEKIVQAFAALGYQLSYRVLDCADYGVPQHRERLIMVGTKDAGFKFPRPTYGPDSPAQVPYVSADEAIANLQDPDEPLHSYNGKYGYLLEEVPPGHNYHYFTREMGYPNPVFAWRSRFSDFLYKADPNKPVRTIVAQLGAYSGPFHWKNRKFTLEEFKRLQSFPGDYQFAGGLNTTLKQIGNSVPPAFAEILARAALPQIFGIKTDVLLIDSHEKLSFDSRKSSKAKNTRSKRATITDDVRVRPLLNSIIEKHASSEWQTNEMKLFHYFSPRKRVETQKVTAEVPGVFFQVQTDRAGDLCKIRVLRYGSEGLLEIPLLRYLINFHHPVGNGISRIEGILVSDSPTDIPVIWDAIEDCLSNNSGYRTMMDVYGHFTEPHPIFDLSLEILTESSSFLLRFAKMFSSFEATSKVLPERVLENLYEAESQNTFQLAKVANYLRSLRFDVRVNETNTTIAPGQFRCCYPFTININKQVSVTWRENQKELYAGAE